MRMRRCQRDCLFTANTMCHVQLQQWQCSHSVGCYWLLEKTKTISSDSVCSLEFGRELSSPLLIVWRSCAAAVAPARRPTRNRLRTRRRGAPARPPQSSPAGPRPSACQTPSRASPGPTPRRLQARATRPAPLKQSAIVSSSWNSSSSGSSSLWCKR
eukprot:SAG22_NODE_2208_length_2835_cov_4.717836_3_plen_157_part_00